MSRCPACPVPAGTPCDGSLCRLAGTAEHWDRHIAGRAEAMHGNPSPPPAPAPPPDPARAAAIAASNRLMARAKRCPSFTREGCSCVWGRCTAGRGRVGDGALHPTDCEKCEHLPPEG